jgi:hypothetical protein
MRWGACLVQRDIINAEPSHKIIDIADMLLVWFWRQKGIKEPFAAVYLADVVKLLARDAIHLGIIAISHGP